MLVVSFRDALHSVRLLNRLAAMQCVVVLRELRFVFLAVLAELKCVVLKNTKRDVFLFTLSEQTLIIACTKLLLHTEKSVLKFGFTMV